METPFKHPRAGKSIKKSVAFPYFFGIVWIMGLFLSFMASKFGLDKLASYGVLVAFFILLAVIVWGWSGCSRKRALKHFEKAVIKQEQEKAVKDKRAVKRSIRSLEVVRERNKSYKKPAPIKDPVKAKEAEEDKEKARHEALKDYYRDLEDLVK